MAKATEIGGTTPTNGGEEAISFSQPFTVTVELTGSAAMLFHAWNPEAVNEKAAAAKGSKAKKTDNVESYIYRNEEREICIPGEYLRQAIVHAAKFRQDPRSPRKSAMDLFKAGIVTLTEYAPIYSGAASSGEDSPGEVLSGQACRGVVSPAKSWDFLDTRRVVVQRNGINRTRPAFKAGWKAQFEIMVLLPEYIGPDVLNEVIQSAGRLIGLGDFRPTYGRYQVTNFAVREEEKPYAVAAE